MLSLQVRRHILLNLRNQDKPLATETSHCVRFKFHKSTDIFLNKQSVELELGPLTYDLVSIMENQDRFNLSFFCG